MSNNLTLDLTVKVDKNGKTYYLAKLDTPALIDCSKGVVFLIFTSETGAEQLQIAPLKKSRNEEYEEYGD